MSLIKYVTLEEEMKKNPELKMSDIQILREWCEKQQHLPKIQDMHLAIFLHRNYYRIEPTKNTIENYFTLRTHITEFFSNRDLLKIEELRNVFKIMPHFLTEGKTKEGYSVIVGRLLDFDSSHYSFNNSIKCIFMTIDEHFCTHGFIPGIIYVLDATGVTMGHIGRITPTALKKTMIYIQDAYPLRLIGIHIINTSPFIQIFFNMVKAIVRPEFMETVHFHSSLEDAKKYFPIDILPNELSGKAGPIQKLIDTQVKKIENLREWYFEDERVNRVNESLRIGENKISNDLFGVQGSFKKLEVD